LAHLLRTLTMVSLTESSAMVRSWWLISEAPSVLATTLAAHVPTLWADALTVRIESSLSSTKCSTKHNSQPLRRFALALLQNQWTLLLAITLLRLDTVNTAST